MNFKTFRSLLLMFLATFYALEKRPLFAQESFLVTFFDSSSSVTHKVITHEGTVSNLLFVGNDPKERFGGVGLAWMEDGAIKVAAFDVSSSSPIPSKIASTTGVVSNLLLTGINPVQDGAAVAWIEDMGVNVAIFDGSSSSPIPSKTVSTIGTVSSLLLTGSSPLIFIPPPPFPPPPPTGVAIAWIENGGIGVATFDGSSSSPIPSKTVSTTGVVSNLLLTGDNPEILDSGAAVAWIEDGGIRVATIDGSSTSPIPSKTVSTVGAVSNLLLTGDFPEGSGNGAAIAWIEGTDIKVATFDGSSSSPIPSKTVTTTGVVSNLLLIGDRPGDPADGAAVAWIEDEGIRIATFDGGSSSPISSKTVSTTGTVSNLLLTGSWPEFQGQGAAIAWIEDGSIKVATFDGSSSSPIPSITVSTEGTVSNLFLTGGFPEGSGEGAAIAWIDEGGLKVATFDSSTTSPITPKIITTSDTVSDLLLTGENPESIGQGAAIAWLFTRSSSAVRLTGQPSR